MSQAKLGQKAPALRVAEWVQGQAGQFEALRGQVILVEVFQVNCPGCFLYSLPQAIELHQRYADGGLRVLGLATAFEDFDKNTLYNLQQLLEQGQLVGESLRAVSEHGQLQDGRWMYRIPFPVAMDNLLKNQHAADGDAAEAYIQRHFAHLAAESGASRQQLKQSVLRYLQQLQYRAETFELYALQGTPSHLLIDRRGVLRARHFGFFPALEGLIQQLLSEAA